MTNFFSGGGVLCCRACSTHTQALMPVVAELLQFGAKDKHMIKLGREKRLSYTKVPEALFDEGMITDFCVLWCSRW